MGHLLDGIHGFWMKPITTDLNTKVRLVGFVGYKARGSTFSIIYA